MNTATGFIVFLVLATVLGGIEAGESHMRKDAMGRVRRQYCVPVDQPCSLNTQPCCDDATCTQELNENDNTVYYCRA
uniref:Omega/Kappa-hexatoxin-Hv1g_6 insecticidal toxin n=1 Tax=Hadronyche versuta TaxID=6904 RepID=S0F208_HADVE|nr:Omega/Kappa-hexatoxin-Hv1g_6 insecticidal toxin [Hadronyche versuta]